MKNKSENLLPKIAPGGLPGTVHRQFKRCGKPNCRCTRGELHGAYFYHFVRTNGRLRKRYLKRSEVEVVQAKCVARQETEKREREQHSEMQRQLRELHSEFQRIRQIINSSEF